MLPDLKISVLRAFHPDEVFGENYPVEKQKWYGPCHMLKAGQEFTVRNGVMPAGFCTSAWVAIYPHVRGLLMGGNMQDTKAGIALVSCNDGLRPVIFKIERI